MNDELEKQMTLENMKKFFKNDITIKKLIKDTVPNYSDGYDEKTRIKYFDKMYENFKDIEDEFLQILGTSLLDSNILKDAIIQKLNQIKEKIINSKGENFTELRKEYEKIFSQMSEKLVEKTKEICVGYYLDRDIEIVNLVKQTHTINELLHVIHSYITNNENILQKMPIIEQKSNNYDRYLLYGENNETSKKIFDKINPEDTKLGTTHILSFSDKVLIMVRDSGHALTIELDMNEKNKDVWVNYFIPKICNAELVNKLNGVRKVDLNSSWNASTSGVFVTSKENIDEEIIDFIEKVPTDSDISYEKINELLKENDITDEKNKNQELLETLKDFANKSEERKTQFEKIKYNISKLFNRVAEKKEEKSSLENTKDSRE